MPPKGKDKGFGKNPPKGKDPPVRLRGPHKAKGNPIKSGGKIFGRPTRVRKVSS